MTNFSSWSIFLLSTKDKNLLKGYRDLGKTKSSHFENLLLLPSQDLPLNTICQCLIINFFKCILALFPTQYNITWNSYVATYSLLPLALQNQVHRDALITLNFSLKNLDYMISLLFNVLLLMPCLMAQNSLTSYRSTGLSHYAALIFCFHFRSQIVF